MKKILLTVIMIFTTSCGYALELQNAVVLDHRSWISGGDGKGGSITGHLINERINFSSLTTSARTSSVNGIVNTNVYTQGSHSYYVTNTTSNEQTYTVVINLCANYSYCFNDQTRIKVNKGGSFSNYATSYLTCSFSFAGNYDLVATTYISGDTSSNDKGSATIYIRK